MKNRIICVFACLMMLVSFGVESIRTLNLSGFGPNIGSIGGL